MDIIIPIELGTHEFSVAPEEVRAKYLTEPGEFVEFIKESVLALSRIDSDVLKIELQNLFLALFESLEDSQREGLKSKIEKSTWVKLKDSSPVAVEKDGKDGKVLIWRVLNGGQELQNLSVYPIDKIHLCNPNETYWKYLPLSPLKS